MQSMGHKTLDTTEQLNNTKLSDTLRPSPVLRQRHSLLTLEQTPWGWLVEAEVGVGREGCLNGRGGGTWLCSVWVSALREGVLVSVSKREEIHTFKLYGDLSLEPRL